jgi:protein-tyrosine sulfotransferase
MNQEPIFLVGSHKSGTSLLRSLFDGHSELFVIPIEAHFFQHLGHWIDYGLRRQFASNLAYEDVLKKLTEWIRKSNNIAHRHSDSDTRNRWNVDEFEKTLRSKLEDKNKDTKQIIEGYIFSMYRSLYNQDFPNEKRIVEKSVENAEFATDLKKMYPNAKFIHILRNPYANFVSIRKYSSRKKRYPFLKNITRGLYNSYYHLEKNKRLIGEDYLIIKYEDLVLHPNQSIEKMIHFVNIANEEILITPTVQRKPWIGNSITDQKYSGVSSNQLDKWKESISPVEVNIINKLFGFILEKWEYEYMENKNVFFPSKNEDVQTYIANRLLLKYFI